MPNASALPRLVAATDARVVARDDFWSRLDTLLDAGVPVLWVRWEGGSDRWLTTLAAEARRRTAASGAELWIGDRADVARLVAADAVQLKADGISSAAARRVVGPGIRIGRAVHATDEAVRAVGEGVDQLVVGTIFASASHPDIQPAGPGLLADVVAPLDQGTAPPRYAIGGIVPARVREVVDAGAHGVVAIGAFWESDDPASTAQAFGAALRLD